MTDEMYCSWVGINVKKDTMPESCKENMVADRCDKCAYSPQIAMGMTPKELLRNIQVS